MSTSIIEAKKYLSESFKKSTELLGNPYTRHTLLTAPIETSTDRFGNSTEQLFDFLRRGSVKKPTSLRAYIRETHHFGKKGKSADYTLALTTNSPFSGGIVTHLGKETTVIPIFGEDKNNFKKDIYDLLEGRFTVDLAISHILHGNNISDQLIHNREVAADFAVNLASIVRNMAHKGIILAHPKPYLWV